MSTTAPRFDTDLDARKWLAYARAEQVINEATAQRLERELDARKRRALAVVACYRAARVMLEAAVLLGGLVAIVLVAASLPR